MSYVVTDGKEIAFFRGNSPAIFECLGKLALQGHLSLKIQKTPQIGFKYYIVQMIVSELSGTHIVEIKSLSEA